MEGGREARRAVGLSHGVWRKAVERCGRGGREGRGGGAVGVVRRSLIGVINWWKVLSYDSVSEV